ncbi:MAG TPA: AMP-binding protein [Acidimicrobiales bacterium]|nr:AMP-binding protein [Acidimicrobiales bacterium]
MTDTAERTASILSAAARGMSVAFHAAEAPERTAIISPAGDRTFAELNARANQLVRLLRRRGLARGSSVALLCSNRPEFVETYAACNRAGFRLTPINWHLQADEVSYIVTDCGAEALVADSRFSEVAAAAATASDGLVVKLSVGGDIPGFEPYEAAVAAEDDNDIDDPELGGTMLYTSGTTGRPKGVRRPPAGAGGRGRVSFVPAGYRAGEDLHLCTGPLYHAAPLAFSLSVPLLYGVGVVLMDGWDPEETLALVDRHRVTHTHMVPTMFHRLVAIPESTRRRYDVSTLRYVLHGAAPCPVPVKRAMIEWLGPVIHEYYAATEGGGTAISASEWLEKPGSVGRPVEGQVIQVWDDQGNVLPAGEVGQVFIKAPAEGRFEYHNAPEKTASTYRGDFFTLGDVGYFDEDGYLFLTGRSAELIISGGVNIYPAEVDAALLTHPAVADAATVGVANDEWGEEVKAVVQLKEGYRPGAELGAELIEHCRQRLAHFKCPRTVDFVPELPRHDNGKLYRRQVRDWYRDGTPPAGLVAGSPEGAGRS